MTPAARPLSTCAAIHVPGVTTTGLPCTTISAKTPDVRWRYATGS